LHLARIRNRETTQKTLRVKAPGSSHGTHMPHTNLKPPGTPNHFWFSCVYAKSISKGEAFISNLARKYSEEAPTA